jgi:hypothetical protein
MDNLLLIVDGEVTKINDVMSFEVCHNKYDGYDFSVIISTKQLEINNNIQQEAEGVLLPSNVGVIFESPSHLEIPLMDVEYLFSSFKTARDKYNVVISLDQIPNNLTTEVISTKRYTMEKLNLAIEELSQLEKIKSAGKKLFIIAPPNVLKDERDEYFLRETIGVCDT